MLSLVKHEKSFMTSGLRLLMKHAGIFKDTVKSREFEVLGTRDFISKYRKFRL